MTCARGAAREPRRVLFLSFAPMSGGVSTYQAAHLDYLAHRERALLVDEAPEYTVAQLGDAARRATEVVRLPLWTDRRAARRALDRLLAERRPDVVAISNPGVLLLYADLLARARRRGARVLLTLHSGVLTITPRRLAMELGGAAAAAVADDIVYVSDYTRRYFHRRYPWMRLLPGRVVPNGIAARVGRGAARATPVVPRVGFVGRLEREKGLDLFLEVAQQLRRRRAGAVECHVFGRGPLEPLLRDAPGVVARGHVDDPAAIFDALDLLLVASPVENCPFVVLEAKAAGVPTVAAAVGGLPEIVADGVDGVFAARRDGPALCDAVDAALARYEALSRGCLASAARYDMAAIGARTWDPLLAPAA